MGQNHQFEPCLAFGPSFLKLDMGKRSLTKNRRGRLKTLRLVDYDMDLDRSGSCGKDMQNPP